MAQARLRSSFIYLANAVNDLRGNWIIIGVVLAPLVLASALCLLPDALNLQYSLVRTFEPGVTSVAFVQPVQMPYAPVTRAAPKPPFPPWVTTILHLLDGLITLVGVNLVVLCALRRMQAGKRMARPLDEGIEVYREAARLLGPFVWVSVLQVLAIAVGAVLLVVPGLLAYVWLYFSQYALIFDGRRSWSALLYSRDLMRGSFFRVALRIVVFLAVGSGFNSWAGGTFFAVSLLAGWVGLITGALWASVFMVDLLAVAVLYTTLAFLLAAGLRLYQDMRAVAAEHTALTDAAPLAPTAPLPSVTA
ncbi:MAG TPA: hypothetical protein VFE43_04475 [Candidatus Binataceae bacterium]|jgi:hypothetical protein|nr:hypothetical protein [Candidatus Binataceae bacterium]